MKVWIVQSDAYCPRIEAACSTRDKAAAIAAVLPEARKPVEIEVDAKDHVIANAGRKKLWMCWWIDAELIIEQAHPFHDLQSIVSGTSLRLMVWAKTKSEARREAKRLLKLWQKGEISYPEHNKKRSAK